MDGICGSAGPLLSEGYATHSCPDTESDLMQVLFTLKIWQMVAESELASELVQQMFCSKKI